MRFIHYGSDKFDLNLFSSVKNRNGWNKPTGGLWASPVNKKNRTWRDWCLSECFNVNRLGSSFKFDINFNSDRILKILSESDIPKIAKYIYSSTEDYYIKGYDFELLSKDYDALYINAGSNGKLYFEFYGWDCDSIIIFNPSIIRINKIGVTDE